jgi:purine-nucleoside/S-methyl-5'-thioadenosine phosphorylase / adenosine deaminase
MPPSEPVPHGETEPEFWRPPAGHFPPGAWFGLATRRGGVSRGPFASLNLGLEVPGEIREAVLENRRRVREALAIPESGPARIIQVHGDRIVEPREQPSEADGFLVRAGDPWAAVTAADCAPVAIVASDASAAALLHCGWRGALAGIAARAVERLREGGHRPAELHASIGPCLHACCFPVGPEVAERFPGSLLRPHPSGKAALDLPGAIQSTLEGAGIPAGAIYVAPECTSCVRERFYSHRRDRGVTGRHWALLRLTSRA